MSDICLSADYPTESQEVTIVRVKGVNVLSYFLDLQISNVTANLKQIFFKKKTTKKKIQEDAKLAFDEKKEMKKCIL